MMAHPGESCSEAVERRYIELKENLDEKKGNVFEKMMTANFLPSTVHPCTSCDKMLRATQFNLDSTMERNASNHLTCDNCSVTFCVLCRQAFTVNHLNQISNDGC